MKTDSNVKGRKPLTQDLVREYLRYCEIEAAKAYDNTVREYHKEFQKVNIDD